MSLVTEDAANEDTATEEHEPDYRFTFANERTFLAWQRTSLGLLAASVAIVQLIPELGIPGARHVLGLGLSVLAIVTSGMGLRRWRQADYAMRHDLPLTNQRGPIFLAVGLIVVGVIAFGLVLIKRITG